MSDNSESNMSREERLAAKLRENLRRRKSQGREMKSAPTDKSLSNGDGES